MPDKTNLRKKRKGLLLRVQSSTARKSWQRELEGACHEVSAVEKSSECSFLLFVQFKTTTLKTVLYSLGGTFPPQLS